MYFRDLLCFMFSFTTKRLQGPRRVRRVLQYMWHDVGSSSEALRPRPVISFVIETQRVQYVYMCLRVPRRYTSRVLGHLRYHHSSPVQIFLMFTSFMVHSYFQYLLCDLYILIYSSKSLSIIFRLNLLLWSSESQQRGVDPKKCLKTTLVTIQPGFPLSVVAFIYCHIKLQYFVHMMAIGDQTEKGSLPKFVNFFAIGFNFKKDLNLSFK